VHIDLNMIAQNICTDEIPFLKPDNTVLKALQVMEEFRVSHLPVVKSGKFLGLITEDDALEIEDMESKLKKYELSFLKLYVIGNQHIFDIIKLVAEFKLTLIPVVDLNMTYFGTITAEQLVHHIANFSAIAQPGSTIMLDMSINDYSMSEIARIVEGNDAKILSSFVSSHPDSTRLEVTLKINRLDIGGVIQTFNRYSYTVSASFQESKMDEYLHKRYDELMKYLDI
jgi:acetoin utilization protein AcuB